MESTVTKGELMKALEPFDDDIEIVIGSGELFFEIPGYAYGIDVTGDGWVIVDKGNSVHMPRLRTVRGQKS